VSAAIEWDETNGTAPGTLTHAIAHGAYGTVDQVELDVTVPANAPVPGTNTVEKWWRLHLTDLGGALSVGNLRAYSLSVRPTGLTWGGNLSTSQAAYDAIKKTAYETPATSEAKTPNPLPTSQPGSANLGIGGSLTGMWTAPGSSDFLVTQIRYAAGALAGAPGLILLVDFDALA
jgi:hypothetical protein